MDPRDRRRDGGKEGANVENLEEGKLKTHADFSGLQSWWLVRGDGKGGV